MLRQRLLLGLGSMILLFTVLAIGAVLLLNRLVYEIDTIQNTTNTYVETLNDLGGRITAVETSLYSYPTNQPDPRVFSETADSMDASAKTLAAFSLDWPADSPAPAKQAGIIQALPGFIMQVRELAPRLDSVEARNGVLESHIPLQNEVQELTGLARSFASQQQVAITNRFRWVVLGVALASIIVINVSILMVLRTVNMVLRPMETMIDATRLWGCERFDHRITLDQPDEFGQLATALNALAGQLEVNEQRKIETLRQTARTLNHELNNALSIISLQVQLLDRSKDSSPKIKDRLDRIRACLARMTGTVDALKHIRRIVLTDYVRGEKMLDLPQSILDAGGDAEGENGQEGNGQRQAPMIIQTNPAGAQPTIGPSGKQK